MERRKRQACIILLLSQITFFIILTIIYGRNFYVELEIQPVEYASSEGDDAVDFKEKAYSLYDKPSTEDNLQDAVTTVATTRPTQSPERRKVKLIVAIVSAPRRADRRAGLRRTWMSDCNRPDVICRFFTDALTYLEPELQTALMAENLQHNDIEFMPIPRGYNFGTRMLWLLEWSTKNYEFDFLLRIDDDYFLCLRRLLEEIPYRVAIPRLYWGYIHCATEGQVRVDEGFLILSADLVKEFVSDKDNLLCHPFGDQTVAIWLNNRTDITRFHDPRVIYRVTAHSRQFKAATNLCSTYLGLHGSYLHENLVYWDMEKREEADQKYWVPSIQPFGQVCKLGTYFDWRKMVGNLYTWKPKPCAENPVWDLYHQKMHIGRGMM